MWKKCWRDRRDLFPEEKSFIYPSETVLGWMGQRSSLLRETRGNKVTELSSRSKLIGCCSVWHPGVQHHRSVCGLSWRLLYHTPGLSYLLFTGCAISGGTREDCSSRRLSPYSKVHKTRSSPMFQLKMKWSRKLNKVTAKSASSEHRVVYEGELFYHGTFRTVQVTKWRGCRLSINSVALCGPVYSYSLQ